MRPAAASLALATILLLTPVVSAGGDHHDHAALDVPTLDFTPAEARDAVLSEYPLPSDPQQRFADFEVRENLTAAGALVGAKRVLRMAHITDLQLIDDDAPFPMRQGLLDDVYGPTISGGGERPQEEYSDEILHSMVDVLNEHHTLDAFDFATHTGDNIDNALENELMRYIDIVRGSHTTTGPMSGFECLPDGQSESVDDHLNDVTIACTSLPTHLIPEVRGLAADFPWYSAYGNHDGLIQGNVNIQPGFQELASGFGRYFIREHEYIAMHFDDLDACAGGSPADDFGHGFGYAGLRLCDDDPDNDGYYAFDEQGIRFIVLDTVNDEVYQAHEEYGTQLPSERTTGYDFASGLSEGALDARQFGWLEEQLNASAGQVVVIMAHHTIRAFYSGQFDPACSPGGCFNDALVEAGLIGRFQMEQLMSQHPNVVAFIGGHTHKHRVTPNIVENATSPGFWNIESSGLLDLPQESRIVELWVTADGTKAFWALDPIGHTFQLAQDLGAMDEQHDAEFAYGTDLDRRVLLWFDVPAGTTLIAGHQPGGAKQDVEPISIRVVGAENGILTFDEPGTHEIEARVLRGETPAPESTSLRFTKFTSGDTARDIETAPRPMTGSGGTRAASWSFGAPGQYSGLILAGDARHHFIVDILAPDGSSVPATGEGPQGDPEPVDEDTPAAGAFVVIAALVAAAFLATRRRY